MGDFELTQEIDGVCDREASLSEYSLDELSELVVRWGIERKIIQNGNPQTQTLKLMSELGELADNIAKGRYNRALDDIGDMIVVRIMISAQINTDIGECLRVAYNDIKDRKGYLNADGIFVKEGDV